MGTRHTASRVHRHYGNSAAPRASKISLTTI
jgi:hypothetical protein